MTVLSHHHRDIPTLCLLSFTSTIDSIWGCVDSRHSVVYLSEHVYNSTPPHYLEYKLLLAFKMLLTILKQDAEVKQYILSKSSFPTYL